jgi:hypothetical protein
MSFEFLADPNVWLTLVTLSALEIVLGIDNLVFISIAVGKLPEHQRDVARKFGIAVACITRIGLLLTLAWLAGLTSDLFTVFGQGISVRDLVLILGGMFLVVKGALEIRELVAGAHEDASGAGKAVGVVVADAVRVGAGAHMHRPGRRDDDGLVAQYQMAQGVRLSHVMEDPFVLGQVEVQIDLRSALMNMGRHRVPHAARIENRQANAQ